MNSDFDLRGLPQRYPFKPEWEIAPATLKQMIDSADESAVLLDCRTEWEREQADIAGSIHAPMSQLADLAEELEEYEDKQIIIFCHHGIRSIQVTAFLRAQGFEDTWSLAGGIDLWSQSTDPAVPRYVK